MRRTGAPASLAAHDLIGINSTPGHAKTEGGEPRASLTVSAPCDPSASQWSPCTPLAWGAEVLWRGPEAARGGRRHDRGL